MQQGIASNSTATTHSPQPAYITASIVDSPAARMQFLPTFFGNAALRIEAGVYNWAGKLIPGYTGGFWQFITLSNGGAFLQPSLRKPTFTLPLDSTNGERVDLSPEGIGIVCTLFALSHLAFALHDERRNRDADLIVTRYEQVREYASQHAEAALIDAAIN